MMKKKALFFVTVLVAIFCLFAISVCAAEPSDSDEFGEITLITDNDTINAKNDFGYAEGDTARVVVKVPGTETYLTYPMYYFFGAKDDGKNGYQPSFDATAMSNATGLTYDATCIIRLELPAVFTAVSTTYSKTNTMTNLKYVKLHKDVTILHASAFANLKLLTTVEWDDNESADVSAITGKSVFENCTALTSIDLPAHLTSMGERFLAGCTSLSSVTIPSRVTAIATANFMGCSALESVIFENINGITAINHRGFDGCVALTGDFAFTNVADIGSLAFQDTGKNDGCYLNISLPNVVSIGQQAFLRAGVKSLSLSEEFTYNSNNWNTFMYCTKLEYVDLSMCTAETYPACFFKGCTSLKVVMLNDNIKTLGKLMFGDCTALEFLYLPDGLTCLGVGDQWNQGAFYNCNSLYFVNEKYSLDSFVTNGLFDATKYAHNKPARPDIYYFPDTIVDLNNVANPFRYCYNINPTIVFAENLTSLHSDGHTFGNIGSKEAKNVVFLGNVTNFYYNNTYENISFYLVGSSKDSLTISNRNAANTNGRVYFCGESGYYNLYYAGNKADWKETDTPAHIFEKSMATEATCTAPKMVANYCFCGTIMGEPQTEGEALGHNYTGDVSYVFTSLTESGKKCTICVNGCGIDSEEAIAPVYAELGYSVKTFGNSGFSFTNGYEVNTESLKLYEETKKVSVKFGFAFNAADTFTQDEAVTLDSFKLKASVASGVDGVLFAQHEFTVNYADDTNLAKNIIIGAYVIENNGESEAITFINRGSGAVNGFEAISYNLALEKAPK